MTQSPESRDIIKIKTKKVIGLYKNKNKKKQMGPRCLRQPHRRPITPRLTDPLTIYQRKRGVPGMEEREGEREKERERECVCVCV